MDEAITISNEKQIVDDWGYNLLCRNKHKHVKILNQGCQIEKNYLSTEKS